MSCPRCGSNDLWDDNLWWGCNSCGYAGNESGGTMLFAKDRAGLARTVREVDTQSDERVCRVCDGGPGNACACVCGERAWDKSAEPMKVPSDDDLLALIREHAFRQYEFDDLLAFARALLARYGQPPQPNVPPEKTDPWYEEGTSDVFDHAQRQAYVDGWNACREAILKGQKGGQ